jgi:hypothetical protein
MDFKKAALWMGIGSIGSAALVIAVAFLFGAIGETVARFCASTLTFGWYGFMLYLVLGEKPSLMNNSIAGLAIVVAVTGLGLGLYLIWRSYGAHSDDLLELEFTTVAWSVGIAWFSQLYRRITPVPVVLWSTVVTLLLLVIGLGTLTVLIWSSDEPEFLFRLLASSGVLATAGTLILPLLRKVSAEKGVVQVTQ